MKPLNFVITAVSSGLVVISSIAFGLQVFAQEQSTVKAACITWAEYSRNLPSQGGHGNQWKAFGTLPSTFQNGCILLQDNNSLDIAYVLKIGISPNPYKGESQNSYQKVPGFNYEQEDNLEQLVKQGKALKVTWLTPTNGAIPYLRSIPHNRAFLRNDGMTCFSTVCMKSGALSHQELARILSIR